MNKQGRGKKRKAENQNVEQEQDYYRIKPIRDHHSQKFNMTAKNYGVHFNNVLDGRRSTRKQETYLWHIRPLNKRCHRRYEFNRPGTFRIKF